MYWGPLLNLHTQNDHFEPNWLKSISTPLSHSLPPLPQRLFPRDTPSLPCPLSMLGDVYIPPFRERERGVKL